MAPTHVEHWHGWDELGRYTGLKPGGSRGAGSGRRVILAREDLLEIGEAWLVGGVLSDFSADSCVYVCVQRFLIIREKCKGGLDPTRLHS